MKWLNTITSLVWSCRKWLWYTSLHSWFPYVRLCPNLNDKLMTACSCHVTYAFQSESTIYSCLNVKELLARSRREIWRLNDECISHISALCTRNLHAAQVGKHSTSSKNILLIALTMKLFSLFVYIKFFILFLFYFFLKIDDTLIFFFWSKNGCFSRQGSFPFVVTLVRSICVLSGFLVVVQVCLEKVS